MSSFTPITCPNCQHYDIAPTYDVLGFAFQVVHETHDKPDAVGLHAAAPDALG
jgi:hypothetical protein